MNTNIDFLKFIAITSVLINHFCNFKIPGQQAGFANGFIALFFIISGYLSVLSFKKCENVSWPITINFFFNKFLRIYPLFVVSFFLMHLCTGNDYGLLAWSGLNSPGLYWFISALIQCYILFIPIYLILNRSNFLIGFFSVFAVCSVLYFAKINGVGIVVSYRSLPGSYFLLFGLGMISAVHTKTIINRIPLHPLVSGVIFVLMVYVTRSWVGVGYYQRNFLSLVFCLSTFWFFVCFSIRKNRDFGPIVLSFSRHSYSLYLFHMFYYYFLNDLGFFNNNSLYNASMVIAVFPLFYCLVLAVDYFEGKFVKFFKRTYCYLFRV